MSNFRKSTEWDTKELFEWALDYYNSDESSVTKLRPSPEVRQTGLVVGEPLARVWLNDAFHNFSQYLKWLSGEDVYEKSGSTDLDIARVENFEPVGTIKYVDQNARTTWYNALPTNNNTPEGLLKARLGTGELTVAIANEMWGGSWNRVVDTATVWKFTKVGLARP